MALGLGNLGIRGQLAAVTAIAQGVSAGQVTGTSLLGQVQQAANVVRVLSPAGDTGGIIAAPETDAAVPELPPIASSGIQHTSNGGQVVAMSSGSPTVPPANQNPGIVPPVVSQAVNNAAGPVLTPQVQPQSQVLTAPAAPSSSKGLVLLAIACGAALALHFLL